VADSLTGAGSADLVEIPGPWSHRYVAANGARFHVTEAGPVDGPAVLLLHGFPQLWWAWRHQIPELASGGYRTLAMDLRGYGGSDKTPNGYDPMTLSQDVSGVVKALGARSAVVVGQGWGGYVGWAAAVLHPREVSALCTVSAPHPLAMLEAARGLRAPAAVRHLLAMQLPMLPERRLADASSGFLATHLRSWSAPGSTFPDDQALATYQRAISLWPASHCALEYHRWLFRSRLRADGRRFGSALREPLDQPVCSIRGAEDHAMPAGWADASARHVRGELTEHRMPDVGHFPPEEDPEGFTRLLLGWLGRL
jgi:pimeloyl-ACP methyl ester carboxylesterase